MDILEVDCDSIEYPPEALESAVADDPLVDYCIARSTAPRVSEVTELPCVMLALDSPVRGYRAHTLSFGLRFRQGNRNVNPPPNHTFRPAE